MNNLYKEKERYNSIEIPQELEFMVRSTVESDVKKNRRGKSGLKRLVPVAIIAFICLTVGVNYLFDFRGNTDLTGDAECAAGIAENSAQVEAESGISKEINEDNQKFAVMDDSFVSEKSAASAESKHSLLLYNSFVQTKIDKSINECVELENSSEAYGELREIYSDDEVVSYSVTTYPSNITNYYNIKQSDGTDIPLEDVVDDAEFDSGGYEYYMKSKNELVIIRDGEEIEIILD